MRQHRYLSSIRKDLVIKAYKKPVEKVFLDLSVGNTVTDPENSYVCQITHVLVKFGGNYFLVDSAEKGRQFQNSYKKRYGLGAKLKVVAVGVSLFGGVKDGVPIKPWGQQQENHIWFYEPKHVVFYEDIKRFESVCLGDMIFFQKSKGVVVSVRQLNKPKFFKTCSWSSRTIWLLNGGGYGLIRFLPDRKFEVVTALEAASSSQRL